MHYREGDTPSAFEFSIPEDLDGDEFASATVTVPGLTLGSATIDEGGVITVSASGGFTETGLLPVTVVLARSGGGSLTIDEEPIVVEPMARDGWHTMSSLRRRWRDAPDDDADLYTLLRAAKRACLAWLDGAEYDDEGVLVGVTDDWREAQYLQARAIWQAGKANTDSSLGLDEDAVRVFPLDWNVQQLLTPKRRVPVIL